MQLLQNPLPSPLAVPIPIQSLSIFTKCKVSTALACHTCNFPPPAKYPYFPRNSRSISVAFDPSKISSLGITGPNSTARKTHTQNTMAIMKEDVERLDLSSAEKKGSCSGKQQESPSTISTTKSTEEPEAGKGGESCKKGQWHSMFPEYMQSRAEERQKEETTAEVAAAAAAAASAMELECRVKLSQSSIGSVTSSVSAPPNSSARPPSQGSKPLTELMYADPIWAAMRVEARLEAEKEPLLSSFLYASILAHPCFERALGFVLANRLQNPTLLATQLMDVFDDVFMNDSDIQQSIRQDVQAVKDRDPSCRSYSWALLYLKGYHALQSYRVAHVLWSRGQRVLALSLQSRISEVFAVDIHPAARIGKGILLDHGTGIVIGETAVVGDRVSLLQGVTLGGTGKEVGDRHPKIGEGVLIGAGATILGNITIGKGAMVAAGSLVLKDIPPHSMVAGTPAKVVGCLEEQNPALTMQHDVTKEFCELVAEDYLHGGAGI